MVSPFVERMVNKGLWRTEAIVSSDGFPPRTSTNGLATKGPVGKDNTRQ